MPSTVVCSNKGRDARANGSNDLIVDKAVEYILAQPDGEFYTELLTREAHANPL
jgi:hypothetical protein